MPQPLIFLACCALVALLLETPTLFLLMLVSALIWSSDLYRHSLQELKEPLGAALLVWLPLYCTTLIGLQRFWNRSYPSWHGAKAFGARALFFSLSTFFLGMMLHFEVQRSIKTSTQSLQETMQESASQQASSFRRERERIDVGAYQLFFPLPPTKKREQTPEFVRDFYRLYDDRSATLYLVIATFYEEHFDLPQPQKRLEEALGFRAQQLGLLAIVPLKIQERLKPLVEKNDPPSAQLFFTSPVDGGKVGGALLTQRQLLLEIFIAQGKENEKSEEGEEIEALLLDLLSPLPNRALDT